MAITRKPAFWIAYVIMAVAALVVAARLFPLAIPIVNLDVTTSRVEAIAAARALATKLHLAPEGARVAARFSHDGSTQNYVELEGGGKAAFTQLARGDRYAPFWWEIRLFTLGAVDETVIRLSPAGMPIGFARRLPETYVRDAARKALDPADARAIAETRAHDDWGVDISAYRLLEQSRFHVELITGTTSSRDRRRSRGASTTASPTSAPSRSATRASGSCLASRATS